MVSVVVRPTQAVLLSIWLGTFAAADERLSYNKDVQPILARHCYACHGPDAEAREAELRLDQRVAALAELPSGATAIVPGKLKLVGTNRLRGNLAPTTAGETTGHLNIRLVPETPARPKGLWEGGVVHRGGTFLGL